MQYLKTNNMYNKTQQIECPVCHNSIFFDVNELLRGVNFICLNCKCSISLASSSSKKVEEAMTKYEELKMKTSINK